MECLICGRVCKNEMSLSMHVRRTHKRSRYEYDKQFGLLRLCECCGKLLSKNCKGNNCNNCRDRSGDKNSFYGKKHKKETIELIRKKVSEISKDLWQNPEYRNKVIQGVSKPRRAGFGAEQSERIKKWYKENPEQKILRSKKMKQSWVDGKIKPNINSINESKLEIELREKIKLATNSSVKKKTIRINKRWFYPDVMIDDKVIVEFYGNYWHANPKKYKATDIVHHNKTAKEIWKYDKERMEILEKSYRVIIVWQDEYILNKDKTIDNIIKIMENENGKNQNHS